MTVHCAMPAMSSPAPAIVVEMDSTTLIETRSQVATVDAFGNILITGRRPT